jgi:signal transduction histidine kinase
MDNGPAWRESALLDAIPDYVFRISRDGTYLDFHAQVSNEVLADRDRFIGSNVRDYLPAEVADELLAAIGRVLESDEPATMAGEVEQDGVAHPFESRIVKSGGDEVVAIVRDLSEWRAFEDELTRSRTRAVAAALDERRRLERDLHDGAQQRLVALALSLRLAAARVGADSPESRELFEAASAELGEALAELRELARGIHPAILTERGLAPALATVVPRAPVPVALECCHRRFPAPVEAAVFYLVSEALTNVAKYAQASSVRVVVSDRIDAIEVVVADDGIGGADASRGSGIDGLRDRVRALGGTLALDSPVGEGTTLRARIPI